MKSQYSCINFALRNFQLLFRSTFFKTDTCKLVSLLFRDTAHLDCNVLLNIAELKTGTGFRLKLEIVSIKFSRKSTNNVYLLFIKDYFRTIRFPNSHN